MTHGLTGDQGPTSLTCLHRVAAYPLHRTPVAAAHMFLTPRLTADFLQEKGY